MVTGQEHWTTKKTADGDVRLFLWEKFVGSPDGKPAVLFVHGSSMASQPTFDLTRARPARLVGDGLVRRARLRLLVRRHGRLWPQRQAPRHLLRHRQRRRRPRGRHRLHLRHPRREELPDLRHLVGRACARRCSRSAIPSAWPGSRSTPSSGPARVRRRWCSGARSCPSSWPPSAARSTAPSCARSSRATIPTAPTRPPSRPSPTRSWRSTTRCPTAPTSTCARSCRSSTRRRSPCRRWCCAASSTASPAIDDLIEFFKRLPSPDKQFTVMNGISHASFQQKNYRMVYQILHAYFTQPAPAYTDPTAH